MSVSQTFPKTDAFLGAVRRPVDITSFSPIQLETELEALLTFMSQAFGPLAISDDDLLALAASQLAPVGHLELALAILCPSELYLASIGADNHGLENELLDARD